MQQTDLRYRRWACDTPDPGGAIDVLTRAKAVVGRVVEVAENTVLVRVDYLPGATTATPEKFEPRKKELSANN